LHFINIQLLIIWLVSFSKSNYFDEDILTFTKQKYSFKILN